MAIRIDYDSCDNAATCEAVCPEDVFEVGVGKVTIINARACTECWVCVDNCTSGAIEID